MRNSNYPFFKFITGDSKVHKMNSKSKILMLILIDISILLSFDIISLSLIGLLLVYIMNASKISLEGYIVNILKVWPLYLLGIILAYLFTFNISIAVCIAIKLIYFILTNLILTFTTSLSEIAWGIECLLEKLKQIKVPVSKISLRVALTLKLISTTFEQVKSIRKSMAYRGLKYSDTKSLNKILIPSISVSIKHVKKVSHAMKLRFYGKSNRRTNYHEFKKTSFDRKLIFLSSLIIYFMVAFTFIYPRFSLLIK